MIESLPDDPEKSMISNQCSIGDLRLPDQVQDFATRWLWAYNNDRPNMPLGVFPEYNI